MPDGSGGSWGGSGTPAAAPTPLPGQPIVGGLYALVGQAKSKAVIKVRGEKVTDPGTPKDTWIPTRCTNLFVHSPLGKSGVELLNSYIVYRDGTGVIDTTGVDRCAVGTAAAWTKCCQHDPVIFICDKFNNLNTNQRANILIHEALHVGGQREDTDGAVGPGNPPNTGQISEIVAEACP